MVIVKTFFNEVLLIKPNIFNDFRGSFRENYRKKTFFTKARRKINFCQDNLTYSKKGVLRGLHYQLHPYSQSKLVSVIEGKVLDVVVDIRKGSPTFGKHFSQELSSKNNLQLFVPRGFAHGFITLSKFSIFYYKVDQYYNSKNERNISPEDPELDIDWMLPECEWIQSEKDKKKSFLKNAELFEFNKDLYA